MRNEGLMPNNPRIPQTIYALAMEIASLLACGILVCRPKAHDKGASPRGMRRRAEELAEDVDLSPRAQGTTTSRCQVVDGAGSPVSHCAIHAAAAQHADRRTNSEVAMSW